jgi:hypothetical protein
MKYGPNAPGCLPAFETLLYKDLTLQGTTFNAYPHATPPPPTDAGAAASSHPVTSRAPQLLVSSTQGLTSWQGTSEVASVASEYWPRSSSSSVPG